MGAAVRRPGTGPDRGCPGALAVFAELEAATEAANDIVGRHAASYGELFATTIVGDWDGARAAAARTRQTSSEALLEDGAAILAEFGMLAIIDLLSGNTAAVVGAEAVADIEWPTPEMAAAANAAFGAMLAADGQLDGRARRCASRGRLLPDLVRDQYWLATLSMAADTASPPVTAAPPRSCSSCSRRRST